MLPRSRPMCAELRYTLYILWHIIPMTHLCISAKYNISHCTCLSLRVSLQLHHHHGSTLVCAWRLTSVQGSLLYWTEIYSDVHRHSMTLKYLVPNAGLWVTSHTGIVIWLFNILLEMIPSRLQNITCPFKRLLSHRSVGCTICSHISHTTKQRQQHNCLHCHRINR